MNAGAPSGRLALFLALSWTALTVYGSLTPFSGWIWSVDFFAWLGKPWPRYWTAFDLLINVPIYIPMGFFWTLALMRHTRRFPAALLAVLLGFALSFSMETLQSALPSRRASNLDLLTNTVGTLLGTLLAAWAGARLRDAWARARLHYALPTLSADFGVLLLVLWLLSLLSPETRFMQTGDWQPLTGWVEFAYTPARLRFFETLIVSAGMATLAALTALLFFRWTRFVALFICFGLAVAIRSGLCAWLYHAPLLWLTPGVAEGLGWGGLLACFILLLAFWLPPRQLAWLALSCLIVWLAGVNLAPLDPIPLPERASLLHFNALTRALSTFWPLAAGLYFVLAANNGLRRA